MPVPVIAVFAYTGGGTVLGAGAYHFMRRYFAPDSNVFGLSDEYKAFIEAQNKLNEQRSSQAQTDIKRCSEKINDCLNAFKAAMSQKEVSAERLEAIKNQYDATIKELHPAIQNAQEIGRSILLTAAAIESKMEKVSELAEKVETQVQQWEEQEGIFQHSMDDYNHFLESMTKNKEQTDKLHELIESLSAENKQQGERIATLERINAEQGRRIERLEAQLRFFKSTTEKLLAEKQNEPEAKTNKPMAN